MFSRNATEKFQLIFGKEINKLDVRITSSKRSANQFMIRFHRMNDVITPKLLRHRNIREISLDISQQVS
jgi:hypothetical protein